MPAKPTTVAQYIAAAPKPVQARLREMRECVTSAAPDAVEGLKWGMPSISYRRVLVTYAAHAQHIGFYPTPSAITEFTDDLQKYHSAAGSVQFPHDKPLPKALITRMTKFRVAEAREKDAKWRSPTG
ncbi:MAG: DUF1801 domain-containing protein [Gemmatimonadota bacterium]